MKTSAYSSLTYSFLRSLVASTYVLAISFATIFTTGCSLTKVPYTDPQCNIQAHIDQQLSDYLSRRFEKGSTPRIAIIPFDVPVNFSPEMNAQLRFGLSLAEMFQKNLLRQDERVIVEIFDRSNWPGKKMDFATGNYIALKQARDAGYDFILIGFMDSIVDSTMLSINTKLIDTENSTTLWYGTSEISSPAAPSRRLLNFLSRGVYPLREDILNFSERSEKLVACTVDRMVYVRAKE